jgi:thiamine biosynthesis protein ThiS
MEIEITLNGEPRRVPEGTSVADLIGRLELVPEQVAVERNRRLVRRAEQAGTRLEAGDEVEVVTLVGGG